MTTRINTPSHNSNTTSASRMQPSRRTMLHSLGTVALPLIYCVGAKSAPAQPVAPLWDSASILLSNGGILLGPDVAQCPLFDTNGRALENGTVTADLTMLAAMAPRNSLGVQMVASWKATSGFRMPRHRPLLPLFRAERRISSTFSYPVIIRWLRTFRASRPMDCLPV